MSEHEREQAMSLASWSKPYITDAFVTGEVEEADIAKLENAGIIVQRQSTVDRALGNVIAKMQTRLAPRTRALGTSAPSAGFLESLTDAAAGKVAGDQFVHDHRDMVIVISSGNDGTAADPPAPQSRMVSLGFVNWCSLGSPASAKNCIAV